MPSSNISSLDKPCANDSAKLLARYTSSQPDLLDKQDIQNPPLYT